MSYPEKAIDHDLPLLFWRDGGVAHLRFNRPQVLNAINVPMAKAFLEACHFIAADPQVRVVWLSGEGRAFMAGGDVSALNHDTDIVSRQLIDCMHQGLQLLSEIAAPVVASVQGCVAGGGLGVMLACDLVVAADGTQINMAYPLIGTSCDCSTSWGLVRVLGLRRAMEFALLSEPLSAGDAVQLGMINRSVPIGELEAHARQLVERLVSGPTQAFGQIKRLLRQASHNDFQRQLDAERSGFLACTATRDFSEGVSAFLDRRKAHFLGC